MSSPWSGSSFLAVEPGPSRALVAALVIAHSAALAVAMLAPLGAGGKMLLGGLVLLGLFDALRAHVLHRGQTAVRSARWLGGGDWELVLGNGETCEARLAPACLVLPRLVVLRFTLGRWRRRTLIVPADAVGADSHRHLRALLLRSGEAHWGAGQSGRGE